MDGADTKRNIAIKYKLSQIESFLKFNKILKIPNIIKRFFLF